MLRSFFGLVQLVIRGALPKILAQLGFHSPGMYANSHRRSLALFEVKIERVHRLVQRSFRCAVGVPSASVVVPD